MSVPVTSPDPSQLSVQPKSVIAGTSPIQSTVMSAGGAANTGASSSSTVMVWVTVAVLLQLSV